MSYDDNTLTNKLSPLIRTQLPEFIQSDHPVFSQFIRTYYQFLESAEVTFSEVNNYLVQETTSTNFVIDEDGDNVVLEDSDAKFVVGETITGLTSGATATVLVDDVDDNKRLFISSQNQFILGETVNGSVSNSSGTIQTYKANPVQNIQQLLEFANVDSTIFKFLDNFRDAFLDGMVDNLAAGVDKRKLTKNIRDLYISKGTRKGHELFFRLLFNDDAVISYPNEQMLRASDGTWTTKRIMRVTETAGNADELIGQTITGVTSGATAIPVSTIGIREAFTDIVEVEIDIDTQTGTFVAGETIQGISNVSDQDVSLTILSVIADADVSATDEGQYYTVGQQVNIASAGSQTATAIINTVGSGGVTSVEIDDAGSNYAIGDAINFDNTGTDGVGISAEVKVVGGAVAPETGDVAAYGMALTDHIVLEDGTQSFMNDTYHGTKIVLEDQTFVDLSVSAEKGSITDIRLINGGFGYTKLPTVSSISTTSGSGGKVLPVSNSGIGSIKDVEITNFGFNYSSAPTFSAFRHAVIKDISGTFSIGDALTSHTGTVTAFDSARQLLSINTTANLSNGNTVATSGASATIVQVDAATITPAVGTIATTSGEFLTERGKVSSDVMRIQDSNYYQDYSYVVRVGESINTWRNAIKRTVHPAGWAVFGEVSIVTSVTAGVNAFTAGDLSVPEGSFTPELASLLTTAFTTIFGRRLGTVDDGTSVRATPSVGSDAILSNTERDLTLTRINTISVGVIRANANLGIGSTLENLAKYAFAVEPMLTDSDLAHYPDFRRQARSGNNDRAYYNIEQFKHFRINQVSTATDSAETFDSSTNKFDSNTVAFDGNDIRIPQAAFTTRINVPPPGEINISGGARVNAFDNNFIRFDTTRETFDETVFTTLMSDTGITFDSSSTKFDGSGGDVVPRDVGGNYNVDFSDTNISFDSGINKFDNSFNIPLLERFSSSGFTFDNSNKTFDIG
jgi:hypothetical protein